MLEKYNITDEEFNKLRILIYQKFGISLADIKKDLVVNRLQKVLKQNEFNSFSEYYNYVVRDLSGNALNILVNKITTNFTYFYREPEHYFLLEKEIIPAFVKKNNIDKDIRIWSAGCSSGEEAYTLVMLMTSILGVGYNSWSAGILATDISEEVLNTAFIGQYPYERMDKLPPAYIKKYFNKLGEGIYVVKDFIKKEVVFRRLNLVADKFPFKRPFHLIFCRNVMIYFDAVSRETLVRNFADNLVQGGYLFLGHSETLGRTIDNFEYLLPSVYRKK